MIGLLAIVASLAEPAAADARAGDLPGLTLAFLGCATEDAREVERMVRADVSTAPGDPTIVIAVQCRNQTVALAVTADDSAAGSRTVDLAGTTAEAGTRAVALIAVEMILDARRSSAAAPALPRKLRKAAPDASTDEEPAHALEPGDPGAADPAPRRSERAIGRDTETPQPEAAQPAVLAVSGGSLHNLPSVPAALEIGARVRLEAAHSRWGASLDAGAHLQRRTVELGTARASGVSLALFAEARGPAWGGGPVQGALGIGVRALVLHVSATPQSSEVRAIEPAWGAALGPAARARVTLGRRALLAELAIDAGWLGPDVVGEARGSPAVGVGGFWIGASLGIGIARRSATFVPGEKVSAW
jgi:hypothetical protein